MSSSKETLRCFVAIDLPLDLKTHLSDLIRDLRNSPIGDYVRWVRPDGIHLTLKFLGEVPRQRRTEIETATANSLSTSQTNPFELTAGGIGVFPKLDQPRVIWVGLGGDLSALARTQKQVETALAAIGFPPENRDFSPHLTLGRVPDVGREQKAEIGKFLRSYQVAAVMSRFTASEAVLMESDLQPSGAIYTPLTHFKFGGNVDAVH